MFQLKIFLFLNHLPPPPPPPQEKTFSCVSFLSRCYPLIICASVWSSLWLSISSVTIFTKSSQFYLKSVLSPFSPVPPALGPSGRFLTWTAAGVSASQPVSRCPLLLSSSPFSIPQQMFSFQNGGISGRAYQNWPPIVLTRKIKILPRPYVVYLCLLHEFWNIFPCLSCSRIGFVSGPQVTPAPFKL